MMISNLLPYTCVLIITVVTLSGCSNDTPETSQTAEAQVASKPTPTPDPDSPADEKLIADPTFEKAVCRSLEKTEGKLTETDLGKVKVLNLMSYNFRSGIKITDEDLK